MSFAAVEKGIDAVDPAVSMAVLIVVIPPPSAGAVVYWLESVAELDPAKASDLRVRYQAAPTKARPDVWTG